MILLRFVFGLGKIINVCSAEQETVENDENIPKTTADSIAKKNSVRQYYFGIYLHRNNTGNFFL